jgi:hypothetical protein
LTREEISAAVQIGSHPTPLQKRKVPEQNQREILIHVANSLERSLPRAEEHTLYQQYPDWHEVDTITRIHYLFASQASGEGKSPITKQDRIANSFGALVAAAHLYEMSMPLVERLALYEQYPNWLNLQEMVYLERFPQRALILIAKHLQEEVSANIVVSASANDFETWLQGEKGQFIRRALWLCASDRYYGSPICDTDDIESGNSSTFGRSGRPTQLGWHSLIPATSAK